MKPFEPSERLTSVMMRELGSQPLLWVEAPAPEKVRVDVGARIESYLATLARRSALMGRGRRLASSRAFDSPVAAGLRERLGLPERTEALDLLARELREWLVRDCHGRLERPWGQLRVSRTGIELEPAAIEADAGAEELARVVERGAPPPEAAPVPARPARVEGQAEERPTIGEQVAELAASVAALRRRLDGIGAEVHALRKPQTPARPPKGVAGLRTAEPRGLHLRVKRKRVEPAVKAGKQNLPAKGR